MKKRRQDKRIGKSMFSVWNFLIFFLTISATVTISFLVFMRSLDIDFGMEIQRSALMNFINVLVLSFVFTLIDFVRRKLTVERPIMRILNTTQKWIQGNFSARIAPFNDMGRMNEFDVIIEDLNKMAVELSGIETLRSDFIANVSHELKTPLAIIQNYATMLQNPELTDERRIDYAKIITDACRKFTEMVMNILKLNKLENQQIYPDTKEYNLSDQLCECLLDFEDVWDKKGLEIDIDVDEEIKIRADAELLTHVWNNLFSNAVKFTEPGGKITVRLKRENGYAVARVADTGCGMPPEVGNRIFEKFYQGDNSHSMQGNGLGLALVKRVIDIVGGEISVESELGKGSMFVIKLRGYVYE